MTNDEIGIHNFQLFQPSQGIPQTSSLESNNNDETDSPHQASVSNT